ncbi:MAG: response regulator [Gammaproteobacteria bacterium]|nr:MAG: response regulator [Gammaproteobacteria bacterium]RLA50156.1 MAG: response regulator [Gammaproteobacteria bacterium]
MTKVLIVDDSPTEVHKLSHTLNKHGYTVFSCETAEEGLKAVKREQPDVVLMDIVMPGLNGFQATRQISKDQETRHIPVIIITMKDQETDKVWAERQGAKAFLTKPVSDKQLLDTIAQVSVS